MVVFMKEIAIEKKINKRELDKRQWYYLNLKKKKEREGREK